MQVKRYEASNIRDILVKIRRDLGPDAIVLSTRQLPGEQGRMEVLAAIDSGFEKKGASGVVSGWAGEDLVGKVRKDDVFSLKNEIMEIKALLRTPGGGEIGAALAEIKDAMDAFIDLSGLRIYEKGGDVPSRIYTRLIGCGFSRKSAVKLLADTHLVSPLQETMDFDQGWKSTEEALKRTFDKAGKEDKRIKVFLGPTGVGKTTTLAKLAARFALEQKKSVGLVTTDTYRIGAVEQLKTYAQIIDLPLEVADTREAFHRSVERFKDKDCILVDTPGRGRDAEGYLSKLKEMLPADGEMEANLLLSLTASRESMIDAAARFGALGCDQIIFTKLDECVRFGVLYDVIEKIGKPVTYFTTGQNVPRDIENVNPGMLAGLVLGSSGYGGEERNQFTAGS